MTGTREDKALTSDMAFKHFDECSRILEYLAKACLDGAYYTREYGADETNLKCAREIRERIEALAEFIDGGPSYTQWLVNQERTKV